jgi:hypothetical protein
MYGKNLISVPRIGSRTARQDAIEWTIPSQVSVAFMSVDRFGYSLIAKVKVKKKHWWNRSWKNFVTHAPTPEEAVRKGLEFLESYGYTIEYDIDHFEEVIGRPDPS